MNLPKLKRRKSFLFDLSIQFMIIITLISIICDKVFFFVEKYFLMIMTFYYYKFFLFFYFIFVIYYVIVQIKLNLLS